MSSLTSVYGIGGSSLQCNTTCNDLPALISLLALIKSINLVVTQCYPNIIVISKAVGDMKTNMYLSPPLYVRLIWRRQNPKVPLLHTDHAQLLQILAIYTSLGLNWEEDPVLSKYLNAPPDADSD